MSDVTVAGDGPYLAEARAMARHLGLELRSPGQVDHRHLRTVFAHHAVFALPSRTEAAPRALMEAMAGGLVPVVSAVGDMPLMVGDVGTVVDSFDPVLWSEALLAALEMAPQQAAQARERARDRALSAFGTSTALEQFAALGRLRCRP